MNILLTGKPGSGKSTLVQELIESLPGKSIAGMVTPEIRETQRTGFRMVDIASGYDEIIASVDFKSGPHVGRYRVDRKTIDRIVRLFQKSMITSDIIIIDEIGKMELFSKNFVQVVEKAFNLNKTVIAVVHRSLVKHYSKYGRVIKVAIPACSAIKDEILKSLNVHA